MRCSLRSGSGSEKKNKESREGLPPGFPLGFKQSCGAHIGQQGVKSGNQIIRADHIGNGGCRSNDAVSAGWAHGAGYAGRPLSTLRALCALRSGSALRSTGADGALRPGCPLLAGWIDDAGWRNVLRASTAAGNLIVAAARLSDIIRQEQHLLSFCCFERRELVFCSPAYSMPEGGGS